MAVRCCQRRRVGVAAPPIWPVRRPPMWTHRCEVAGTLARVMATITVYREYGIPLGRRIKVLLDERVVGRVRGESSVSFTVPAGRHTVRVVLDWQSSAPVVLELDEEDTVVLRARVDLRATSVAGMLTRSDQALDLDVM